MTTADATTIAGPATPTHTGPSPAELFGQHPDLTEYICHRARRVGCIYVETPKVACTTIKRVLQSAELGPDRAGELPADVHDRATSPLMSPGQDPGGFVRALTDARNFCFGFVRNPYSRALSCWLDKMVGNAAERERLAPMLGLDPDGPPSLGAFLAAVADQPEGERDPHWATQTHLLNPHGIRYAFIGRFEHFRPDFSRVCAHLGIEAHAGDLPATWHATDASAKVGSHVNERDAALIRRIYEADFRNFGYGWGNSLV
jgi:hypothetical protein